MRPGSSSPDTPRRMWSLRLWRPTMRSSRRPACRSRALIQDEEAGAQGPWDDSQEGRKHLVGGGRGGCSVHAAEVWHPGIEGELQAE